MQKLYFVKNQLHQLYLFVLSYNYYLAYKYLVIKAFASGRKRYLYFLRFLFSFNRLVPGLFVIFTSLFNLFTFIIRGSSIILPVRFWLLILHHFRFFYETLLTIRVIVEWFPSINLHQGNVVGQIIFDLSEPYFKTFGNILPRGLSALLSYYLIDHICSIIEFVYRIMVIYGGASKKRSGIKIFHLVGLALSGESIVALAP